MMSDQICVGAIAGAFGVRGEVRLKSFCATPDAIGEYGPFVTDKGVNLGPLKVTGRSKDGLVGKFSGISNKEDADALRGAQLMVPRARLPNLPDDEFYHADLIGLEVVDTSGQVLGRVRAIYDHGAGDIIEVAAERTLLLPFTRAIVPTVDLTAGRIVADPPLEDE